MILDFHISAYDGLSEVPREAYSSNLSDTERSFRSYTSNVPPMLRFLGCGTVGSHVDDLLFFSEHFRRAIPYNYRRSKAYLGRTLFRYQMDKGTSLRDHNDILFFCWLGDF